jgi:regulator of protease activity HflC (stomatin/prohibitin superfamily)
MNVGDTFSRSGYKAFMFLGILLGIAFFAGLGVVTGLRVLREYERAIVFRLGRARQRALGPGMVLMLPFGIDRATVVDTRTKVIQIPTQEVITRDNISIGVDAVVYIEISSPMDAILRVEQYMPATLQLAATTLRAIIGRMELDEVLAKRAEINNEVAEILEARVEQWGVNITAVEIKDISLPAEMKRAMARQAEAERERRAKIIMSEGELQAAQRLAEAARLMSADPAALQLRLYQTMLEVSSQPNTTVVLPVPIELLPGVNAAHTTRAVQAAVTAAQALAGSTGAKQLSPSPAAESSESLKALLTDADDATDDTVDGKAKVKAKAKAPR